MRQVKNVTIIDLRWEGPFFFEEIEKRHNADDHGLYQIYGTHSIFGPDALLYIGLAEKQTFSRRIATHRKKWADWEPSEVRIYLGQIGGLKPLKKGQSANWKQTIKIAEKILIHYCPTPYNSQHIANLKMLPPYVILNINRHHRLPYVVSNLWYWSPAFDERFQPYSG